MRTRVWPLWLCCAPSAATLVRRVLPGVVYGVIAAGLAVQGVLIPPVDTAPERTGARGPTPWMWEYADEDESFPARCEPWVPRPGPSVPVEA